MASQVIADYELFGEERSVDGPYGLKHIYIYVCIAIYLTVMVAEKKQLLRRTVVCLHRQHLPVFLSPYFTDRNITV